MFTCIYVNIVSHKIVRTFHIFLKMFSHHANVFAQVLHISELVACFGVLSYKRLLHILRVYKSE
jgi:hypothetical protein